MGYIEGIDPVAATGPRQIDGTIGVDQIVQGDLVFTSRPGLLQDLCNRAGEPWRHVGIAIIDDDGRPAITEVSRTRFDIRPMARVVEVNDEVAVGRVSEARQPQADAAADWCRRYGGGEQIYAWHDVMLAGLIATARHYSLTTEREPLQRAVEAAADVVGTRRPNDENRIAYTCSGFIAEAMTLAGCGLEFDLRVPRSTGARPGIGELLRGRDRIQLRASRPTTKELGIVLYALFAGMLAFSDVPATDDPEIEIDARLADIGGHDQSRWAMPGDLWRSPSVVERLLVVP